MTRLPHPEGDRSRALPDPDGLDGAARSYVRSVFADVDLAMLQRRIEAERATRAEIGRASCRERV